MFDYVDPIGTGVLQQFDALEPYRRELEQNYVNAAGEPGTAFAKLEQLPAEADVSSIVWPAFPITAPGTEQQIDDNRFDLQDEYVEWQVEKVNGAIPKVTFLTEFPEHYEALAAVSVSALMAGIKDAIPGAEPTEAELFGGDFDDEMATPQERVRRFRSRTVVPFGSPLGTQVPNPWNNGSKGVLCLAQQFNTMGALFNLAAKCSVANPTVPPEDQCASVGGACGSRRNSDPRICTAAQVTANIPRLLSLRDPVGVRILRLGGTWKIDDVEVDINDPNDNQGIWTISRNGRKAVLDLSGNVTLDEGPIATGAQVSRVLDVGADVVSAVEDDLMPAIAAESLVAPQAWALSRTRADDQ